MRRVCLAALEERMMGHWMIDSALWRRVADMFMLSRYSLMRHRHVEESLGHSVGRQSLVGGNEVCSGFARQERCSFALSASN